jgi:cytochrome bd-type quinol oxidase subunit 2
VNKDIASFIARLGIVLLLGVAFGWVVCGHTPDERIPQVNHTQSPTKLLE